MSVLDEIANLFERQVGVKEKPINDVIYNTDYYGSPVNGEQFPWCAAFIWDVFRMAGHPELFLDGGKSAYCPYIEGWAKQHSAWVTDGYKRGDLVLFDWNGDREADHIGFCLTWNGASGVTIEGNAGDQVSRLTRQKSSVVGAYRPDYSRAKSEAPSVPVTPTPDKPKTEPSTNRSDVYVVKDDDNLWAIAARFLGNGIRYPEIMSANNLKSSTIYPGQVLKLPSVTDRRTFTVTVAPETYRFLFDAAAAEGVDVGVILDRIAEGKI